MRVIVPGGCYSYDSAGKKIWLDYQYYGTTLENIEKIKNLTRNKILYDCKRPTVLPTVANGCITHSYQGTEADTDKIQVTLKTPITNSLTELTPVDGVVTLETDGKVLVLPTSNAAILPSFNQSVLNSNRLSVAESPFGGMKGSGSPDYCPGTLYTPTDGVYLTDLSGTNSTKTLTAGKLKELNLLSVDTTNHSITEEFVVTNTSVSNNPTVISDGTTIEGWSAGTGILTSLTTENGRIKAVGGGTISVGFKIVKIISLAGKQFLKFKIECNTNKNLFVSLIQGANKVEFRGTRFPIPANAVTSFVLPIHAPAGTAGLYPSTVSGTMNWSNNVTLYIGTDQTDESDITFYLDDIQADVARQTTLEIQVPDYLADTSAQIYTHNGTAYQLCSTHSLDGVYSQVSQTSANFTYPDSTKFDDVYGTGLGRAVFPKGSAGATVNGSSGSITYSNNLGTDKRIGLKVDLPPSDNGRTNFNKVRAKLVINYAPDAENVYSATHIFADSTNTSYGLQNLSKPWIALYDPTSNLIDFYLFTYRPKNLEFKRDESGTIYEVRLYPGNGLIYHGQITFSDLTRDTNSDSVPDCLEAAVDGSVTKFLANYSMVI